MLGSLALASAMAALFFWHYWKQSQDRLFVLFAAAFSAMTLNWICLAMIDPSLEGQPYIYLVRLLAFLLIIAAVVDKNRRRQAVIAPGQRDATRGS
jgi:O-antigen/teichoic acid export membrane protein